MQGGPGQFGRGYQGVRGRLALGPALAVGPGLLARLAGRPGAGQGGPKGPVDLGKAGLMFPQGAATWAAPAV